MFRISLFAVIFIGFLTITGCLDSPEAPENNNTEPTAYIEGRVQDSDGESLNDINIDITTFDTNCGDGGVNHGTVSTDNEGKYLTSLTRSEEDTVNCITLRTSSKTHPQFEDSTIERPADLEFKTSEPYDYEILNISY